MRKSGGIVTLIAGILGFLAAIFILFVGGVGTAFNTDAGDEIIFLGLGGLLICLVIVVLGAIAMHAKTFIPGVLIIITSIIGIIYGGSFVGVLMLLALVGGVLACMGNGDSEHIEVALEEPKSNMDSLIGVICIAGLILIVILFISKPSQQSEELANAISIDLPSDTSVHIESFTVDPSITPNGELAEIFAFYSDHTDLQRELKLKEIKGKVIAWSLPVYDIKSTESGYRIQTDSHYKNDLFGEKLVGTFINITARNDEEKQLIQSLKTGDLINIKGMIDDISMRNLNITNATLMPAAEPMAEAAPADEETSLSRREILENNANSFLGKAPLDLLNDEYYLKVSKKLLGNHYDKFLANIAVSSGIEMDSTYLLGFGCSEGICPTEQAAFAIDKLSGQMFAVLVSTEGDLLFGADSVDKLPANLQSWYAELNKLQTP